MDHAAEAGRWTLVAALDPGYPLPSRVADDDALAPPPDRSPQSLLRDALLQPPYAGLDSLLRLLSPADLGASCSMSTRRTGRPLGWLLDHGADADVRDGLRRHGDVRPARARPSAMPLLQALLRRGVSPAGAGGLARFLAACSAADQAGRGLERTRSTCSNAAPTGWPLRRLAIRRWRWPCASAGPTWSIAWSPPARTWKRATAMA